MPVPVFTAVGVVAAVVLIGAVHVATAPSALAAVAAVVIEGRPETPEPAPPRPAPPQRQPQPEPARPSPQPPRSSPLPPVAPSPPVPAERAAPGGDAIPALTGPVVDAAGILDADDERILASLAYDVKKKTSAEIAVLTVRTTAPLDEFTYGMKVVSAWKLGSSEKDDGLLLLVAVDDRRARFFTGYGLEGVLPDGRLGALLDRHVVSRFRGGDYPGGIRAGMTEIARILTTEYDGTAWTPYRERGPSVGVAFFLVLFVLLLAMAMFGRKRRRYLPIFWGGGFGGPMRGGFGGGFGGGGGGFGGGFGGGGGGFGGGGAGRSW